MADSILQQTDPEKIKKALEEIAYEQKECARKGHPNAIEMSITTYRLRSVVNMYCPDCGLTYQRPLGADDLKRDEKLEDFLCNR